MDKLQELYKQREAFSMWGSAVPEALAAAIAQAEKESLYTTLEIVAGSMPSDIETATEGNVTLAAEYVGGKLSRVGASSNIDFSETFQCVKDLSDTDEEETENDENTDDSGSKRSRSIGFTVKFADGKVIKRSTARRTMIEALRYMGLERGSKYRHETFMGFPLIGKEQRITEPQRDWQRYVDGWWIYVNMTNPRAIACIKGVADMLNIPLEIELDADLPERQPTDRPKGKRIKYSLNGGEPTWKNRTVWNAVRNLLKELPNATFKEIADFFPKQLQGSYGVVATIADIEERSKRNKSEYNRWFLDPSDILTAGDGTKFTVSTEWGENFENFRNHVVCEFGWTITEV